MASLVNSSVQLVQNIMETSGVTCSQVYVPAHLVKSVTFVIKNALMVHTECDVKKDVSLAIMGPNVILSLDFVNVYPDGWANSVELNVKWVITVKNVNSNVNVTTAENVGRLMERASVCQGTLGFIAKKVVRMAVMGSIAITDVTVANTNTVILFLVVQRMLFMLHTARLLVINRQ